MRTILTLLVLIPFLALGQNDKAVQSIQTKLTSTGDNPVYNYSIAIENGEKKVHLAQGTKGNNSDPVSIEDPFKIASCTKLFVATIVMQLQEEGKLKIDDYMFDYLQENKTFDASLIHVLNHQNHSYEITIRQLLNHRSGLADIFTDKENEFFNRVFEYPQQNYTPNSILELYWEYKLNTSPHFSPGNGWFYSDINYVLLGLIIEKLDQKPLHLSIRERILKPLNLKHTYFEYLESPTSEVTKIDQYMGSLNFSEVNTSFDWAGGGLVSTHQDLLLFIKALFQHQLINASSLEQMIDVQTTKANESKYGLGIYEAYYNGKQYFGHYGFYGTFIGFCPETNTVLSYCISQATPNFNVYSHINELVKMFE